MLRSLSLFLAVSSIAVFSLLSTPSQAQSGPAPVPPPPGITAWWSFDETSGVVAADRMGQSPAAYQNNPTPAVGLVRGSIQFNGSNYLSAQDSSLWALGSSDFSIEFWVNFDTPQGGSIGEPSAIFIGNDEGPGSRNKWFFALGGGYLEFHINSPSIGPKFFPLVPFSPTVGQWYHLAVVRSGYSYTVYIDGEAAGSATDSDVIPTPNAPLTIGQAEQIGFVHGRMDELTVYNRALSASEVQGIYNAGSAGKTIELGVIPASGGNTGIVTLTISGTGFVSGAQVGLNMLGQPSIQATSSSVSTDGSTVTAVFDLIGAALGKWDLTVSNPTGPAFVLPAGFKIVLGGSGGVTAGMFNPAYVQSHLQTSIVGLGVIVVGRTEDFAVNVVNSGNVDANNVSVLIGVPKSCNATFALPNGTFFSYSLGSLPASPDPNFSIVRVNVGKVAAFGTVAVPVALTLNDATNSTIFCNALDTEIIHSRVGSTALLSPSKTPTCVRAVGYFQSSPPNISVITVDGYTTPSNGQAGQAVLHEYLVIGNTAYCVGAENSQGQPTLDKVSLDELNADINNTNSTKSWTVDPNPVYPTGPGSGNQVTFTNVQFITTQITASNFPSLFQGSPPKWQSMQETLDDFASNHYHTGDDCISTINNVTKVYGLDLEPNGTPLNDDPTYSFDYCQSLGFDAATTYWFSAHLFYDTSLTPAILNQTVDFNWVGSAAHKSLTVVRSFDPNDIAGPVGVGPQGYVPSTNPLGYFIQFENSPTASAPAQVVTVTDQLNPLTMDLTSFQLGPIAFGSTVISPPAGSKSFAKEVDLRPNTNLLVRINASLDINLGLITWQFTSIDPATGTLPTNPLVGFLPPDINPPAGLGSVQFIVSPLSSLSSGIQINNSASIVFDLNPPLSTSTWTNTFDAVADISSQVSVTRGGYAYNRAIGEFVQTVTLKNVGISPISGPISLVLDNLNSGAALANSAGLTAVLSPARSPYVSSTVSGLLPGASTTLTLQFSDPSMGPISYTTRILAGIGVR